MENYSLQDHTTSRVPPTIFRWFTVECFGLYAKNHFVGNKAKGQIWKRVFQENKAHQIFRKTNISYRLIRTLIRTRTCAYQGARNVSFLENLTCFVFSKHPFCLISDDFKPVFPFTVWIFTAFTVQCRVSNSTIEKRIKLAQA